MWCLTPLSTIFQLDRGGQFYKTITRLIQYVTFLYPCWKGVLETWNYNSNDHDSYLAREFSTLLWPIGSYFDKKYSYQFVYSVYNIQNFLSCSICNFERCLLVFIWKKAISGFVYYYKSHRFCCYYFTTAPIYNMEHFY